MSTGQAILIALLVLVPAALLWGLFLRTDVRRPRSPGTILGIPHALRPAAPDEVLEGRRLERLLAAGAAATLATAVFIPLYWLPERQRQEAFQETFDEEAVERGELIFAVPPPLPEEGDPLAFREAERAIALGMGCANCHSPGEDDRTFAQPPSNPLSRKRVAWVAPPLGSVFQRWDEEIVRFTIERGRPGTPMPTWGVEYGGPMTDQMVDDVMAYLQSLEGNQRPPEELPPDATGEQIFEARCAVCHGPQAEGKEGNEKIDIGDEPETQNLTIWYPGLALWKGDVRHLDETLHLATIRNGRRFAFMPPFADTPSQGIPAPPYPLTDQQIEAVMEYERSL